MRLFRKKGCCNSDQGRMPTQEEIRASLNPEGNANAKLPQQQQKWSNQHRNDAENGPETAYTEMSDYRKDRQIDFYEDDEFDEKPIYIVKQNRGYLSIFFSVAQTAVLIGMMVQCSIAPMNINREYLYFDTYAF